MASNTQKIIHKSVSGLREVKKGISINGHIDKVSCQIIVDLSVVQNPSSCAYDVSNG